MLLQANTKDKSRGEVDPDYAQNLTAADRSHLEWQEKALKPAMKERARRIFRNPRSVSFGTLRPDPRMTRKAIERIFGKRKTA